MLFFLIFVALQCSYIQCADQVSLVQQLMFPLTLTSPFLQVPQSPAFTPSPIASISQASTPDSRAPDRHPRRGQEIRHEKPYTRQNAKTFDFRLNKQPDCDCKQQLKFMEEKLTSISLQLELSDRNSKDTLKAIAALDQNTKLLMTILGEMLQQQSQYEVSHYRDLRKLLTQRSTNVPLSVSSNAQTFQASTQRDATLAESTHESLQKMVSLCTEAAASHLHSAESISAQTLIGSPRVSRDFEPPSPLSEQAYKHLQNTSLNLDPTPYMVNSDDERKQPVANIDNSMPS